MPKAQAIQINWQFTGSAGIMQVEHTADCFGICWSYVTGITLIEMAQMDPPYNNMNPSRVLMKIRKADPPMLDAPHKWYYYYYYYYYFIVFKRLTLR